MEAAKLRRRVARTLLANKDWCTTAAPAAHISYVSSRLMKRSYLHLAGAALLAVTLARSDVQAQTVASDYKGGGSVTNFDRATGWNFTLNQNVTVTGLGLFDLGGNGFASSHDVGIFRSGDQSAVVTTSLAQGLSGTYVAGTVDGSRFNTVNATLLSGVEYYILGNNFSVDNYVFGSGAVSFASTVNWIGFTDGTTNSITSAPKFNGGVPGDLGPNFIFTTATVTPEPASFALIAAGLMIVGVAARRRRKN